MFTDDGSSFPKSNDILEGSFWPEPVRVLAAEPYGECLKIEAVGTWTQKFYSRVFRVDDLARVGVKTVRARDFGGDGELFFLAIEAHRIRNAAQFDPFLR